jgi:hypothetical protein
MTGQTIRIYLVDAIPMGILTGEIMNWTGKVTACPRYFCSAAVTVGSPARTMTYTPTY